MQKRREHPRLKFGIIVEDSKHHKKGETRNISVDGCFIEKEGGFSKLLPVGSHIELTFDYSIYNSFKNDLNIYFRILSDLNSNFYVFTPRAAQ